MSQSILAPAESNSGLALEFKTLAENYAALIRKEGVLVQAYHSADLLHFRALPVADQLSTVIALERALRVASQLADEGFALRDTGQWMWRSLRGLGMTPEQDLFNAIGPGDVVQIFSTEQRIVFWNLRLMELVSFTIEQLYCTQWWLLAERPKAIQDRLSEVAAGILSGQIERTVDPQVPEHIIEELGTGEKLRFLIRMKCLSPLRTHGRISGLAAVNEAHPI